MSEVARVVGLGIVVSVLLTLLRKEIPPLGVQVAAAFVGAALLMLMEPLGSVVRAFGELAAGAQIRTVYLALVMKAVAIAFVTSIGAELSRDAGEGAIGSIVELTGKVFILLLGVPVIAAILDALVGLLPG